MTEHERLDVMAAALRIFDDALDAHEWGDVLGLHVYLDRPMALEIRALLSRAVALHGQQETSLDRLVPCPPGCVVATPHGHGAHGYVVVDDEPGEPGRGDGEGGGA